ncbi:F510_1955 family glycosylhydrolase [Salininema proteolyticum]|uniref:F510_1955 family glycosylhydrolase n=1 Tax=Salininema proteolyticum TaxID=1607685 RepID=A0ABV8U4C2_9ACTN
MTIRPRHRALAASGVAVLALTACTDGGDDAQPGEAVDQFTHLHGVEAPAWAEGTVYLATHQGLLALEDDEWTRVSEKPHDFMGFSANPDTPETLYSSGHPAPDSDLPNPLGFMTSTDGGATWQETSLLGEVDFHAMDVGAGGDSAYGYNSSGKAGLYASFDQGTTWEVTDTFTDTGGAYSLAAHPTDPDTVWAGTPEGLHMSTDQGTTWTQTYTGAPVTAVALDPAGERLWAYAAGEAGLITSTDQGATWEETGWALDDDEDAVGYLAVDPTDADVLWAGTRKADVYRSGDAGTTWETKASAGTVNN